MEKPEGVTDQWMVPGELSVEDVSASTCYPDLGPRLVPHLRAGSSTFLQGRPCAWESRSDLMVWHCPQVPCPPPCRAHSRAPRASVAVALSHISSNGPYQTKPRGGDSRRSCHSQEPSAIMIALLLSAHVTELLLQRLSHGVRGAV